jgi:hypothetical protein
LELLAAGRNHQIAQQLSLSVKTVANHLSAISSRQVLEAAQAAMAAAETFGLDAPVGQRLARVGAFLERVSLDQMESADRWRALLA